MENRNQFSSKKVRIHEVIAPSVIFANAEKLLYAAFGFTKQHIKSGLVGFNINRATGHWKYRLSSKNLAAAFVSEADAEKGIRKFMKTTNKRIEEAANHGVLPKDFPALFSNGLKLLNKEAIEPSEDNTQAKKWRFTYGIELPAVDFYNEENGEGANVGNSKAMVMDHYVDLLLAGNTVIGVTYNTLPIKSSYRKNMYKLFGEDDTVGGFINQINTIYKFNAKSGKLLPFALSSTGVSIPITSESVAFNNVTTGGCEDATEQVKVIAQKGDGVYQFFLKYKEKKLKLCPEHSSFAAFEKWFKGNNPNFSDTVVLGQTYIIGLKKPDEEKSIEGETEQTTPTNEENYPEPERLILIGKEHDPKNKGIYYTGILSIPSQLTGFESEICASFYKYEGKADAINTHDTEIITLGSGFAKKNAFIYLSRLLNNSDIAKDFDDYGVKIEGDTITIKEKTFSIASIDNKGNNFLKFLAEKTFREVDGDDDGKPSWFYELFVKVLQKETNRENASIICWECLYVNPIVSLKVVAYVKSEIANKRFETSIVPRIMLHSAHWRTSLLMDFTFTSAIGATDQEMLKEVFIYYFEQAKMYDDRNPMYNAKGEQIFRIDSLKSTYYKHLYDWLGIKNSYLEEIFTQEEPDPALELVEDINYFILTFKNTTYYLIK